MIEHMTHHFGNEKVAQYKTVPTCVLPCWFLSKTTMNTQALLLFSPRAMRKEFQTLCFSLSFPSALWAWSSALHPPRLRSLDVMSWNPLLIVSLGSRSRGFRFCWRLNGEWLLFRTTSITTTKATGPAACSSFGSEVRLNPDRVEGVTNSDESREEKEIQEYSSEDGVSVDLKIRESARHTLEGQRS